MAPTLERAICRACRKPRFAHDGRGYIEWVCTKCGHFNVERPRPTLPPPLTARGRPR